MDFIELQLDEAFKSIEAKTEIVQEIEILLIALRINKGIISVLCRINIPTRHLENENRIINNDIQVLLDKLNKL